MSDLEIFVRLSSAALAGGLIGIERELHGKEAGLRTHCLVSLGSALIMLVSIEMFHVYKTFAPVDPSRIAAQVVTGIGFLGAGTIIRSRTGVVGLTTAAGLWTASGIGLACGMGYFRAAVISSLIVLFVLTVFAQIGKKLGSRDV